MSIAKQMEKEKESFWVGRTLKNHYVTGDVLLFKDYSGIVHLNGQVSEVQEAIDGGSLDAKILSFGDDFVSIVPILDERHLGKGAYSIEVRRVGLCSGDPDIWLGFCMRQGYERDVVIHEGYSQEDKNGKKL